MSGIPLAICIIVAIVWCLIPRDPPDAPQE